MKAPLFLLLFAIASCVHHGKNTVGKAEISDCLSDISGEVIAIPLETNEQCRMEELKQVKCAGTDIFIWSNDGICHFDRRGAFKNRIATGIGSRIHDYAINAEHEQLIVLDSLQQLYYYTYERNDEKRYSQKAALSAKTWEGKRNPYFF
jgi:hypothetical protein